MDFAPTQSKNQAFRDLKEVREEMLKQAFKRTERASDNIKFKIGESENKKKSKNKRDKKDKKSRKSKKSKKRRKRTHSSSDSDSSSASSSSEGETAKRASKKNKKRRKKKEEASSESSSTSGDSSDEASDTGNEHEWVEKPQPENATTNLARDSWMTDSIMLKTYTREKSDRKFDNNKPQMEQYDPTKSVRELNPYWKTTGTGLPAFQKPKDDDEHRGNCDASRQVSRPNKNWQKKDGTRPGSSNSMSAVHEDHEPAQRQTQEDFGMDNFLTDQQMNELGAKVLKAEIMGNNELAAELKKKLELARENRGRLKTLSKDAGHKRKPSSAKQEEHVLLTHTDQFGKSRPLEKRSSDLQDPRDLYGGRAGRKAAKKYQAETHLGGERVRFFPDDDKYDIKQMFEREKYSSAADSNLEFAQAIGKHKNPRDDLEDIFADNARKQVSEGQKHESEQQRAKHEHEKLSKQMDNCEKCMDSGKMDNHLVLSMGTKVYLRLPWHVGLQPGHCLIVPIQHVACSTQLDEDTWEEISNYRKALTQMFASLRKDVIFFEIANKLHRRPHLTIHCVPISEDTGEMAPFYFKKAIEESEHEWSVNKQLISLKSKGLRSSIPKGLPYFWVHFGMDTGFAHVIEDENRFPDNYAQEIIGGMLHLNPNQWRKPQKEQNSRAKVNIFADWWKKYDVNKRD